MSQDEFEEMLKNSLDGNLTVEVELYKAKSYYDSTYIKATVKFKDEVISVEKTYQYGLD